MSSLILIGLVWLIMVVLVNPRGNFPLNDDWNYALSVKSLLLNGSLLTTEWTLAAAFTQVIWGALFCLPFGFSFEALRVSSLCMGLIGAMAVYFLIRTDDSKSSLALIGALTMATSPIYFELANTFMTDIPFIAVATLAFLFLMKTIESNKKAHLVAGTILTLTAVLSRQTGLVIPLSFAVIYLIKYKPSKKHVLAALVPLSVALMAVVLYQTWLKNAHDMPLSYQVEAEYLRQLFMHGPLVVLVKSLTNWMIAFIYLGLFLFPFLLRVAPLIWQGLSRPKRLFLLALVGEVTVLVMAGLTWKSSLMPLADNILFDCGLGPLLLKDITLLHLEHWPHAPWLFWFAVTGLGVSGGAFLLAVIIEMFVHHRKVGHESQPETALDSRRDYRVFFAVMVCLVYMTVIMVRGFFDRYLLFLMPLLMVSLAGFAAHLEKNAPANVARNMFVPSLISFFLIGIYAAFSLSATHDYLSWNRARWQAVAFLTEQEKVLPAQIDGGLEFNGWFAYDAKYGTQDHRFNTDMSRGDKFIITLGPVASYREIKRFPFARWLPAGQGEIFVLQKESSAN